MSSLSSVKNILNYYPEQCYINKLSSYSANNFTAGAADVYNCCGTAGINRTTRFELFGR